MLFELNICDFQSIVYKQYQLIKHMIYRQLLEKLTNWSFSKCKQTKL